MNEPENTRMTHVRATPRWVVLFFFFIGLFSSVAFRALIVIQRLDEAWVRPLWYFGVTGFIAFFLYTFVIAAKRKRLISERQLLEKLQSNACLYAEDREAAIYLLKSLDGSLEKYNYIAIFVLSVAAIVLDVVLTRLGK